MASASSPGDRPGRLVWLGLAAIAAGAVLLVLGWWGASGEAVVALQLPYIASASIPGAALVVAGAVLVAGEPARRSAAASASMVTALTQLLTEAASEPPPASAAAADAAGAGPEGGAVVLVTVPGASHYHRASCVLVAGKAGVEPVDAGEIEASELLPCPICAPAP